ncbi:MAG: non-canonical purine NTP pyrophosphatase [Candidatus Thermoplasmatota archaeon]|nr:non-canonical purine NTP pyrophosphatase [Candidatus Thermoplasmatota archaeon]
MQLWFMTGNKGKLLEAKHAFSPLGFNVEQFVIDGLIPEIIEPQCDTLEEVAEAKITQGIELLKSIGKENDALLVEDSGFFIEALDGFPGVYSAYVLEKIGCEGILKLINFSESLNASFRASACLWDGKIIHRGSGICPGRLVESIRGENGFGYDPIFTPFDYLNNSINGLTFGEVDIGSKEKFSHRKKALDEVLLSFQKYN